ncbi:MAG: Crp/Fnr family transcriptional regulator [Rubrivivax sp.]|nr:Crp/Fnr family transcriptional regulator [Rubrivivax sp.]
MSAAPLNKPDPTEHPALTPALRELSQRGELRRFRRGAVLIHEGDFGQTMFIILSGRLRAYSASALGDKEITFGTYGPGDYVGEISLDGGPRSASVDAVDACLCSVVTRRTIEAYLAQNPSFAFELLAKVTRRAREATLSARQMALEDVYGRLRRHLLASSTPQADGTQLLRPRPTHKAIAQSIGCGREMVSRVLKQLERGGYVEPRPGELRLLRALPPRY